MIADWLSTSWTEAGLIVLSTPLMLLFIIVAVRIVGLRSFSKMSSFDFAATVATGSILAGVAATSSSLANGCIAVVALFATQRLIAILRQHTGWGEAVDNEPLLLLANGEMIAENLQRARVTTDDLRAKLREANVLHWEDAEAVVLESTGDISVLHGGSGPIDTDLLADVIDGSRYRGGRP